MRVGDLVKYNAHHHDSVFLGEVGVVVGLDEDGDPIVCFPGFVNTSPLPWYADQLEVVSASR